ncbi:hypothetical protein BH20BAC1_BH20BAC1_26700 [soil metagenome]
MLPSCSAPLRFSQVSYDASVINNFVDNEDAGFIFFQFKRLETRGPKNSLSLTGYVYKNDQTLLSETAYDATVITPGKSIYFKNGSVLGNLLISKNKLLESLLTDPDTHERIKYTSLLFTPQRYDDNIHIYYEITLQGAEQKFLKFMLAARPCPPAVNCISKPGQ